MPADYGPVMIGTFIADIWQKLGWRAALLVLLTGLTALFEGLALAILLPLLQHFGVGATPAASDTVTGLLSRAAASVGLTLTLPMLTIAILLVVTLQVAVFLSAQSLSGRLQARYLSTRLNEGFDGLIHAKWTLFRDHTIAQAISSLTSDLLHKTGNAFIHLMVAVSASFFIVVYGALALALDWRLALFMIAAGLGFVALMRPLSNDSRRVGERLAETDQTITALISDYLGGIKVLKVFGLEDAAKDDFTRETQAREASYFHYIFDPALSRAVVEFFAPMLLLAALIVGAGYLHQDVVVVLVVIAIFARLYPRLSTIQHAARSLDILLPAFLAARDLERSARALREPDPGPAAGPEDAALSGPIGLEVEGLVAGYGEDTVLRGLSLSVPAGAFVVIGGASGAGKTTLIDALLGLIEPSEGQIRANGMLLSQIRPEIWRRHIGYVDQDSTVFPGTIASNIAAGLARASADDVVRAARLASAQGFIEAHAGGYERTIGERGKGLSGGQRQRIAIARALARRPGLLLLDEATSALDAEAEAEILEALERLKGETTIVFVSHRDQPHRLADRAYMLARGAVARIDSSQEP